MNIAQNLEIAAVNYPDTSAVIFEETAYSYSDVNERANRYTHALASRGVRFGDRVALLLPNVPHFIFAYFGVQKLGAVAVSINARLKPDEVKFILADSGAVAVITSTELLDNVPSEHRSNLVVVGQEPHNSAAADIDLMATSPEYTSRTVAADVPCAILYTSGTTGAPKGAVLSHGNVDSNVAAAIHHCGLRHGDRMLVFVPLFHCFGQNAIMNCAVACGATLVLHRQFIPSEILASVAQNRVTHFYGVPTTYIWLLNAGVASSDLAGVRYFFSAAAKLPLEIAQQWRDLFSRPIHEGYGLTETSPFSSYNHESHYRLGSVGTPIRHVEMQVWDEHDQELPAGVPGEIVIRGRNVMLGYWKRHEETSAAMRGGWFHSGDIGYVDEDGYFYITDRLKDMINVSGMKVYPAEVENVLYQHAAVHEAAVYGVPDDLLGEAVWATVVIKPGYVVTAEELLAFCNERIATFKVPRVVRFDETIPKNPTGKVLKRVLVSNAKAALVESR